MNPTPFRCPSKAKYQCLSWEGIPNMSQINLHILMTNCSYDHLCILLSNLKIQHYGANSSLKVDIANMKYNKQKQVNFFPDKNILKT